MICYFNSYLIKSCDFKCKPVLESNSSLRYGIICIRHQYLPMKKKRLIILPHDVSIITGKSIRASQRLLKDIHFVLGKLPHQPVSVPEFADYMGLEAEEVERVVG
jgi:hypothetical protein